MHIIKDFVTFYARNIRDAFKIVNFCLNYIYNFACILCAWKAAVVLAQECHQPPTNCKLHLCRSVSDMTSDMQRIDRGRDFWVWSLIWDKKKRVVYQLWRPRLKWINGAKKHWLCATGAFFAFCKHFSLYHLTLELTQFPTRFQMRPDKNWWQISHPVVIRDNCDILGVR